MNKTYSAKPSEVTRRWILIDASEAPLGRIATVIATYLTGKNKPMYTPHIDCGDYVVVTNAAKLVVTGNKLADKKYYRYSGFPGGMREMTLEQKLEKDPANVIELAVKGMLPKNKLAPERLARLRVFVDENHGHAAQKPEKIEVKHG
ncbi:MAG TPA: 50S ribosomal protein L13 [Candidatus Saccharibacteria bacterium]|jgi:large subunit ribosomal protein L13|nr:large subunit ribosomal protein [Patescibacteria group bacterium]HMS31080.1 50S ribosomal protein L13 [Candidatus Saccharibacteria bacterium]